MLFMLFVLMMLIMVELCRLELSWQVEKLMKCDIICGSMLKRIMFMKEVLVVWMVLICLMEIFLMVLVKSLLMKLMDVMISVSMLVSVLKFMVLMNRMVMIIGCSEWYIDISVCVGQDIQEGIRLCVFIRLMGSENRMLNSDVSMVICSVFLMLFQRMLFLERLGGNMWFRNLVLLLRFEEKCFYEKFSCVVVQIVYRVMSQIIMWVVSCGLKVRFMWGVEEVEEVVMLVSFCCCRFV